VRRARRVEREGKKKAELVVEYHEITIESQDLPERLRGHAASFVWPEGQPLPGFYLKPQPVPCSRCRRLRLDDGAQAVILLSISCQEVAYLRCKACGHRFALPVRPAR